MVADILRRSSEHRPTAFLDSAPALHGQTVDGLPVVGGFEAAAPLTAQGTRHVVVAIGDNHDRVRLAEALAAVGLEPVSAIHPLTSIAPSAQLGRHLIIGPRVTICVHASIGDHCVLSSGCIIEHDNVLGRGVFLDPAVRLAGGVTIEAGARVGIGACVIPGRRLGRVCTVEPGTVVIRDVPMGASTSGVPGTIRPLRGGRFVADPQPPVTVPIPHPT